MQWQAPVRCLLSFRPFFGVLRAAQGKRPKIIKKKPPAAASSPGSLRSPCLVEMRRPVALALSPRRPQSAEKTGRKRHPASSRRWLPRVFPSFLAASSPPTPEARRMPSKVFHVERLGVGCRPKRAEERAKNGLRSTIRRLVGTHRHTEQTKPSLESSPRTPIQGQNRRQNTRIRRQNHHRDTKARVPRHRGRAPRPSLAPGARPKIPSLYRLTIYSRFLYHFLMYTSLNTIYIHFLLFVFTIPDTPTVAGLIPAHPPPERRLRRRMFLL